MKYLLALETATPRADVALVDADGLVRARRSATAARHSANLLALCAEALDEGGVTVASLSAVACGAGPGSFTGLRVGMAVAKGLAMPFELPFLAISSLQALAVELARGQGGGSWLVPCLDGGKGQIFGGYFRAERDEPPWPVGETLAAAPGAFLAAAPAGIGAPVVVGGPGTALLRGAGTPWPPSWQEAGAVFPSAVAVAQLAWRRFAAGERDDLATSVPVYGRAPDITTPKKARG